MSQGAVEPVYPFAPPGKDIDLYEGTLTTEGARGNGRIWLQTTGDVEFRWEIDDPVELASYMDARVMALEHTIYGPSEAPIVVSSSTGHGLLNSTSLGEPHSMDVAIVHWMNVPYLLPLGAIRDGNHAWRGRLEFENKGWRVTMDNPADLSKSVAYAQGRPVHLMSHAARIDRAGQKFSAGELDEFVSGLRFALSVAVGCWVAPAISVGYLAGQRIFECWTSWSCDSPQTRPSAWWDLFRHADLVAFLQCYLNAWMNPQSHDRVMYYSHHVVEAGAHGITESRVLLLSAANEYLSWIRHVTDGNRSRRTQKAIGAADVLRELLQEANINGDNPADLHGVAALIATVAPTDPGVIDGPGAINWIRNRLAHPRNAHDPYTISESLWEAWLLLQQYSELILLHDIGYEGHYRPRFPFHQHRETRAVPW